MVKYKLANKILNKKLFLRISLYLFAGKQLCWSFILMKLQLQTPIHEFSYEHFKILKNTYFEEHL